MALLSVWRQARSFCCLCGSKLVVFCVTPVWLSACVFVLSLWGCTCSFMPVRRPACGFKKKAASFVLFYACVAVTL